MSKNKEIINQLIFGWNKFVFNSNIHNKNKKIINSPKNNIKLTEII